MAGLLSVSRDWRRRCKAHHRCVRSDVENGTSDKTAVARAIASEELLPISQTGFGDDGGRAPMCDHVFAARVIGHAWIQIRGIPHEPSSPTQIGAMIAARFSKPISGRIPF
jgi:hypothetical protein